MVHFQSSPWGFNTVQLRSRLSYHLKENPMPFAVVMANVCPCTARHQPLGCSKSKKFGEEWEKIWENGAILEKILRLLRLRKICLIRQGRPGVLTLTLNIWRKLRSKWSEMERKFLFLFFLKSSPFHSKIQVLNWLFILSWVCICVCRRLIQKPVLAFQNHHSIGENLSMNARPSRIGSEAWWKLGMFIQKVCYYL